MPNGSKPKKVIVSRREKHYRNEHKNKIVESDGWEIVKELSICMKCTQEAKGT